MFDNYVPSRTQTPISMGAPREVVRFDRSYLSSKAGILHIVQILFNLLGFICKFFWRDWLSDIFYNILYWTANIVTGILLFAYTFHIVEKYHLKPWFKVEYLYCTLVSLTYVVTSTFALASGKSGGYAVGFFGLCALVAYSIDCYLKYKGWKKRVSPQL